MQLRVQSERGCTFRCKKHLDEANEIVSIKQNMIDALRCDAESCEQS